MKTGPASGDTVALYPGSFDPPTRGHFDLIERAARLFGRLEVTVITNPEKRSVFSAEERIALLEAGVADTGVADRVRVSSHVDRLTVALAAALGARWIVRGLRSAEDAGYELPMAHSNRRCGPEEIDTVFLPSSAEVSFISSTLVRQIAERGGRLEAFVTPAVEAALREKFGGAQ